MLPSSFLVIVVTLGAYRGFQYFFNRKNRISLKKLLNMHIIVCVLPVWVKKDKITEFRKPPTK